MKVKRNSLADTLSSQLTVRSKLRGIRGQAGIEKRNIVYSEEELERLNRIARMPPFCRWNRGREGDYL